MQNIVNIVLPCTNAIVSSGSHVVSDHTRIAISIEITIRVVTATIDCQPDRRFVVFGRSCLRATNRAARACSTHIELIVIGGKWLEALCFDLRCVNNWAGRVKLEHALTV
jgi:hypothetical protein